MEDGWIDGRTDGQTDRQTDYLNISRIKDGAANGCIYTMLKILIPTTALRCQRLQQNKVYEF